MAAGAGALRLPVEDDQVSDGNEVDANGGERSDGRRSQPGSDGAGRPAFLDEVGLSSLQFAVEHEYYDMLILEYDDDRGNAVAYVAPVCGAEEAGRGGLSVVALPHAIHRRRLADRVL